MSENPVISSDYRTLRKVQKVALIRLQKVTINDGKKQLLVNWSFGVLFFIKNLIKWQ
jgi:hypothetical protein